MNSDRKIDSTADKDTESRFSQTLRVKKKTGGAGRQIAFGNQTIFTPRSTTLGERLLVLRPYLAAGLPLSVQSYLERTGSLISASNSIKHRCLIAVNSHFEGFGRRSKSHPTGVFWLPVLYRLLAPNR